MGHAVEYLSFDAKEDRKKIQKECDEWGSYHCDPYERGGCRGGLGGNISFTDRVYNSYDEAVDYLEKTIGNYRQTAVKYYKYPEIKPTKTLAALEEKRKEYCKKISVLNKPHYKGVKQATVKCKKCGSSLATAYCGNKGAYGYINNCPVCGCELRPESVLAKLESYTAKREEIAKRIKDEEKKINEKQKAKATLHWLVCCEVHC